MELEKHNKHIAQPLKRFMFTIKRDPSIALKIEPSIEDTILSHEKSHPHLPSPAFTLSHTKAYDRRSACFPGTGEQYVLDSLEDILNSY